MKNSISMTQFAATMAGGMGIRGNCKEGIDLQPGCGRTVAVSEVYGVVCTRAASYAAGRTGLHRFAVCDAGLFWNDVYGSRAECTWNPEVREARAAAGIPV